METARGFPHVGGSSDIHMNTAKGQTLANDIRMQTATSGSLDTTTLKGLGNLKLWEREFLDSAEVKRKATVAQLCR